VPAALAHPLADPDDCIDFEFDAPAGRYTLWIELRTSNAMFDSAVWPQVNEDIGTERLVLDYMGSMGYLNGGGAPLRHRFQSSGWLRPGAVVFAQGGRQRLRIQPRLGRPDVGRVLLSPTRERRPPDDVTVDPGEILLPRQRDRALRAPPEVEIYPAQTKLARRTTGTSELMLALEPDNHGVLLRRTLDYQYAHQRAVVSVWHDEEWCDAGVWYLAGSNTVYHSFPIAEGELGPVRPTVITSNRRFRDDEFLLPVELTRGKRRVRLRFAFAPRNPPLLPGMAPAESAWTEIEYRAYCYVMPKVEL
jgi:hypothetical protein